MATVLCPCRGGRAHTKNRVEEKDETASTARSATRAREFRLDFRAGITVTKE